MYFLSCFPDMSLLPTKCPPSIQILKLDRNRLAADAVGHGVEMYQAPLVLLDASYNHMYSLAGWRGVQIRSLRYLFLSYNTLSYLPERAFAGTINIEVGQINVNNSKNKM